MDKEVHVKNQDIQVSHLVGMIKQNEKKKKTKTPRTMKNVAEEKHPDKKKLLTIK